MDDKCMWPLPQKGKPFAKIKETQPSSSPNSMDSTHGILQKMSDGPKP